MIGLMIEETNRQSSIVRRQLKLVQLLRVGPGRESRHHVKLLEDLLHHRTGVVALTYLLELRHHARERVFRLRDRHLRVVLTLLFEASVALSQRQHAT